MRPPNAVIAYRRSGRTRCRRLLLNRFTVSKNEGQVSTKETICLLSVATHKGPPP